MVQCCRCNKRGLCQGCACVKAGRSCSDCLPGKLGNCSNSETKPRPSTQPTTQPPSPPTRSFSPRATTTMTARQPPTDGVSETSGDSTSSTISGNSSQAVSNSCPPSIVSDTLDLPLFKPMAEPNFTWGERDSMSFCKVLQTTYDEVVHWRKNCFKIPSGNAGKSLVDLC